MMSTQSKPAIVLLVTSDGMGQGDTALRQKLIQTYFKLLDEHTMLPAAICFLTDGVKLVVTGSPVLEVLHSLATKGVHLIICQTCLDYFGLSEQVEVGVVGGMTDIMAAQWQSDKVVTL